VLSFRWDIEKNAKLLNDRGISFEEVVFHIENGHLLDIVPGKGKYAHQKQFIVEISHYAHIVPFIETANEIFLKTVIPSREMTKKYLRGGPHERL
jgi:uncharacterized DUF497 family protein